MIDPIPYREAFPVGSVVRVAGRSSLEAFISSWRYHHKLQPEQLAYAERVTTVEELGFYHGGDPVYSWPTYPACGWSNAWSGLVLGKLDETAFFGHM